MTVDPPQLDLSRRRRIHVVNAGGAGMSGIGVVLAQMGHVVTGVDANETPFLAALRTAGAQVTVGSDVLRDAADIDAVVVSTATPADHPDVALARRMDVPVLHRRDVLPAICALRSVLAVAGTHGKTTTTAMIATILDQVGDGSGFLVGSRVVALGTNADWRTGPGFVIEADESDGTFLALGAADAVVTNQEPDHLSYWGSETALAAAFDEFVAPLPGRAVLCLDDPGSARLVGVAANPVTYGTHPQADYRLDGVEPSGLGVSFVVHHAGLAEEVIVRAAPGLHNARNATAAIAAVAAAGVPLAEAARALGAFAGLERRFEHLGTAAGVTFVDSYDHLPTEVVAALDAARSARFERVVCVFQPHRYTRTRDLSSTFADAFVDADLLAVTELYSAGEPPIEGVSGRLIADAVSAAHPTAEVAFLPGLDAVVDWLLDVLRPGDLCLTLNAGDLRTVPPRVLAALQDR